MATPEVDDGYNIVYPETMLEAPMDSDEEGGTYHVNIVMSRVLLRQPLHISLAPSSRLSPCLVISTSRGWFQQFSILLSSCVVHAFDRHGTELHIIDHLLHQVLLQLPPN